MGRLLVAVAVLLAACGGKREVGSTSRPIASSAPAAPAPAPPRAPPVPVPDPGAQPPPAAAAPAEPDFAVLTEPAREDDRRTQFARAVAAISQEVGAPITSEKALADMPCGGWSGPDCSNLTLGIEIAKTCAPIIASFHRKKTAEIAGVLAEAISIHSVWHDAYGYVWRTKKKGPGYTYAGCLFSKCDPGDLKNGQVDGILYQVGRLIGAIDGPACGPGCTLIP